MKRIALNMLFIAPGVAGVRVYCEQLLGGLAGVDTTNHYTMFTRRGTSLPLLPGKRFQQCEVPVGRNSALWRTVWEYGVLPSRVRKGGFDLFHGLGNLSPGARGCPFVLTIHDLIPRHFPQSLPAGHRWFTRHVTPVVARRADRIIVPSQASARDVVHYLGVNPKRLRLVAYGPGIGFRPVEDAGAIAAVLNRLNVRRPYLISVGRTNAHKNLAGLLRAFARLRERGFRDLQLVLVGERYRAGDELDRLSSSLDLAEAVIFTGFIPNDELNALYSAATAFAFPSLCEGFGLPILEAMACGAPVVASNVSAIPEAVSTAGLLADARDPDAFATALARVIEDPKLQDDLRNKGRERVRELSWEKCARETLAVYQELL